MLEEYRTPDPVYDREERLLRGLVFLELAEQAIAEARYPYAMELLQKADTDSPYCREALSRRRLLLLGRIPGQRVSGELPALEEELMLRAEEALTSGNAERAGKLLEAAEDRESSRWNLLRGRVYLEEKDYRKAAQCLHLAEAACPKETAPLLEHCYRELEDYRRAYEYACRQK